MIGGEWDDRLPGTDALQKLNDVMAHRELPRVKAALLNRIATALDGKAPLTKYDRSANAEGFKRLLSGLQEFGGFMGGALMTAAITRRAKLVFNRGDEDLSFESTVGILQALLPSPAARIGYLLDLMSSEMGRKKAALLAGQIAELFTNIRTIHDFAPDAGDSLSQDAVREDFRRRLYGAGIPRRLADGLMQRLEALSANAQTPSGPRAPQPPLQLQPPQPPQALRFQPPPRMTPPPPPPLRPAARPATVETMAEPAPDPNGTVVLTHRGTRFVITPDDTPFVIGRGSACQLAVEWGTASRSHAEIKVQGNDFVLIDHSKNGTFLAGSDRTEQVLTNSSQILTGEGTITIGRIGTDPQAVEHAVIHYQRLATGA